MSAFVWVNVLGGLLIVTSTMVVLASTAKKSALLYMLQSFVLVLFLASLAVATQSQGLFMWSASAFLTKVVLVPGILIFTLKKIGPQQDFRSKLSPAKSIVVIALEVLVCFAAIDGIDLYTTAEVKPALAISLAHFFIGLTCIISQRNIVKQIFGYCLMENGSHVTLALLAPQAPEIVEIGIATDAIFAVLIMAMMAYRLHKSLGTLDSDDLMDLKG